MLRYINKRIRNRKGFSLIELIVVVGILGILAMVAIPRVTTSLETAKVNTDKANLRTLNNTVELYYAEKGTWPSDTDSATFAANIKSYLPTMPAVQVEGKSFVYDADATGAKVTYIDTPNPVPAGVIILVP